MILKKSFEYKQARHLLLAGKCNNPLQLKISVDIIIFIVPYVFKKTQSEHQNKTFLHTLFLWSVSEEQRKNKILVRLFFNMRHNDWSSSKNNSYSLSHNFIQLTYTFLLLTVKAKTLLLVALGCRAQWLPVQSFQFDNTTKDDKSFWNFIYFSCFFVFFVFLFYFWWHFLRVPAAGTEDSVYGLDRSLWTSQWLCHSLTLKISASLQEAKTNWGQRGCRCEIIHDGRLCMCAFSPLSRSMTLGWVFTWTFSLNRLFL